jgi:hypothetical protein
MLFDYPTSVHIRRYAPAGYRDYRAYKGWLRDEFQFRCVFCLYREMFWSPRGVEKFGVDHIKSRVGHPDLASTYENLVYACNACNSLKGRRTLIDPCSTAFADHLLVSPDGRIHAGTSDGARLIDVLKLDDQQFVDSRRVYMNLHRAHLNARIAGVAEFSRFFRYPDLLPDLASMQPPANPKADAVRDCYFERRRRGELEETY